MSNTRLQKTTIVWTDPSAQSVGIRGTFGNDQSQWWQKTIFLSKTAHKGREHFAVDLQLAPGQYEFKFVINGTEWQVNSTMYRSVRDQSGNINNVISVESTDAPKEPTRDDKEQMADHGGEEGKATSSPDAKSLQAADTGKQRADLEQEPLLSSGSDKNIGRQLPSYTAEQSGREESTASSADEDNASDNTEANVEEEGGSEPDKQAEDTGRHSRLRRYALGALLVTTFTLLGAGSALFYS
ncbi:hypothetical protein GGI07_004809 [Coemansia sp. Benny D115]|nr:hypothetical protein GGI07_004809 [Coemansia sp. Benny D115]